MRISLVALAMGLLIPLSSMAQPSTGNGNSPCLNNNGANCSQFQGQRMQRNNSEQMNFNRNQQNMFRSLNLTAEQQAVFDEQMQSSWEKHQVIRNKFPRPLTDTQRQAMRDENTKVSVEAHRHMRAVLTTDQQAEFDKITAQRRVDNTQRMMQRQNNRGMGRNSNNR